MVGTSTLDPATAEIIRNAIAAARFGRLADAIEIVEAALRLTPAPPLSALLGLLQLQAGNATAAVKPLREAMQALPTDTAIALNLAAALSALDQHADLLDSIPEGLAAAEKSGRLLRLRGFAAQQCERFLDAVAAYRLVVERQPDDWESWNNLGNALTGAGEAAEGAVALTEACRLQPGSAPVRINLARTLIQAGQDGEAERVLIEAGEQFGTDELPLLELSALHKRQGHDDRALADLQQAVLRKPGDPALLVTLGGELCLASQMEEAESRFLEAIALDSTNADAHIGLAVVYEHDNQADCLPRLADEARDRGVPAGQCSLIEAFGHRRAGHFAEAVKAIGQVPQDIEVIRRFSILGESLDRLGDSDAAFAAFQRMNDALAEDESEPLRRAAELRERLASERRDLGPDWLANWRRDPLDPCERTPVFLVGFPRSGTTLLDTLLMGHTGVEVMEERPAIPLVDRSIGGFEALAGLSGADIHEARERYFAEAARHVPLAPGKLLVDKMPLFLNRVPIICRLFPEARFILALRHPADVLLSCFVSNFRLNQAMSNFLRLDTAAELYDLSFGYWTEATTLLEPRVHSVRYENMVENPEAQLRPLVDWLGLPWNDALLDHRKTAAERGLITTASYAQVHEPIYRRSSGRWTRYARQLEPVFPVLRPWAERFGYEL